MVYYHCHDAVFFGRVVSHSVFPFSFLVLLILFGFLLLEQNVILTFYWKYKFHLYLTNCIIVQSMFYAYNLLFLQARGVNYLHHCNPPIIHRDLKSSNILVDKNWTVKVCHFSLFFLFSVRWVVFIQLSA